MNYSPATTSYTTSISYTPAKPENFNHELLEKKTKAAKEYRHEKNIRRIVISSVSMAIISYFLIACFILNNRYSLIYPWIVMCIGECLLLYVTLYSTKSKLFITMGSLVVVAIIAIFIQTRMVIGSVVFMSYLYLTLAFILLYSLIQCCYTAFL